jgi:hypothetical protein
MVEQRTNPCRDHFGRRTANDRDMTRNRYVWWWWAAAAVRWFWWVRRRDDHHDLRGRRPRRRSRAFGDDTYDTWWTGRITLRREK